MSRAHIYCHKMRCRHFFDHVVRNSAYFYLQRKDLPFMAKCAAHIKCPCKWQSLRILVVCFFPHSNDQTDWIYSVLPLMPSLIHVNSILGCLSWNAHLIVFYNQIEINIFVPNIIKHDSPIPVASSLPMTIISTRKTDDKKKNTREIAGGFFPLINNHYFISSATISRWP